ncbi:nucleotidyltransferase domain-containing protein [Paenibacillus methanolicus]|uniref:Nucleotidyltransferase-like protein n=1 Tax=Paenibacillus methanolicus TaxID=582686 RepID=A0A5S5C5T3_9BACL|nr:nucleotidyltransferase domain-containing protein [Paenibacillus methanolicus]TYP73756.1 nucleotidyltransferase-like protein [Paenibacillus methanolicus]
MSDRGTAAAWLNGDALGRLHPEVRGVLEEYAVQVHEAGLTSIRGFFLYGSIAMGGYTPNRSDIDFVALLERALNSEESGRLAAIHRNVGRERPSPEMNGIYVTRDRLGKLPHEISPYPCYYGGRFHEADWFECNLVTWHQLKKQGIALYGSMRELDYEVDWDRLLSRMRENVAAYWRPWVTESAKLYSRKGMALYARSAVEWGVLGLTRLYYTFRENEITTKAGAGAYALEQLPASRHPIVIEALRWRSGESSLYRSASARRQDALDYLHDMLAACESAAEEAARRRLPPSPPM